MVKFLTYFLKHSKITSNGIVTLLSFVMMSIGFIANLFWSYEIDRFIYESMQWIVMIGLGATASEKVSKQFNFKSKHTRNDVPKDTPEGEHNTK